MSRGRPARLLAGLLLAGAMAACLPWQEAGQPAQTTSVTPRPGFKAGPAPAVEWPTFLGDPQRSGVLGGAQAPPRRPRHDWSTAHLDGDVYGSPIVAGGLAVVATENDTVYAFDAGTGSPRWRRHLATPVQSSALPCGNISPVSGITGTPVADRAGGLLYVVAFEQREGRMRHVLHTLDLGTGVPRAAQVVDPPGASPATHLQRGALALADGYLYVPFGGLFGDCGSYRGSLVGVPVSSSAQPVSYRVPCDNRCAVWAPPGPTIDPGGDVWVATGNGQPTSRYTYANSVLRLSPDLRLLDSFAPANWASLSASDTDLGSTSPVLVGDSLVWMAGKEGRGYLLRRRHLGGIGGQAYAGTACSSWASSIYAAPFVYLACPGAVTAVSVDASRPSFSIAWRQSALGSAGGAILACGSLWAIDTASGKLAALAPDSGKPSYSFAGGSSQHFATPAAATGHVYAALGGRLVAVAC